MFSFANPNAARRWESAHEKNEKAAEKTPAMAKTADEAMAQRSRSGSRQSSSRDRAGSSKSHSPDDTRRTEGTPGRTGGMPSSPTASQQGDRSNPVSSKRNASPVDEDDPFESEAHDSAAAAAALAASASAVQMRSDASSSSSSSSSRRRRRRRPCSSSSSSVRRRLRSSNTSSRADIFSRRRRQQQQQQLSSVAGYGRWWRCFEPKSPPPSAFSSSIGSSHRCHRQQPFGSPTSVEPRPPQPARSARGSPKELMVREISRFTQTSRQWSRTFGG